MHNITQYNTMYTNNNNKIPITSTQITSIITNNNGYQQNNSNTKCQISNK